MQTVVLFFVVETKHLFLECIKHTSNLLQFGCYFNILTMISNSYDEIVLKRNVKITKNAGVNTLKVHRPII